MTEVERAVLHGMQHAGADRHGFLAERTCELRRWRNRASPGFRGQVREYVSSIGYPPRIANLQVGVRAGGAELGLAIARNFTSSGERQHPEFAGSDEVGGNCKQRIAFWNGDRSVQHVIREIVQLSQNTATDALQDVSECNSLGVHEPRLYDHCAV